MKTLLIAGGLALAVPGASVANEWRGDVTLGYSKSDISLVPNDVSAVTLDLQGEYRLDNGLSFGVGAAIAKLDISGAPVDVDVNHFALDATYRMQNGVKFGAFAERGKIDVGGLGNAKLTTFGALVGYETDRLDAELYFGKSDVDPSLPIDIKEYGLRANYWVSESAFVTGGLARSRVSAGGTDVDLDLISLGGGYAFNDAFSVFGGLQKASVDIANLDATTLGIGIAYKTQVISNIPTTFSLELARTSLDIGGPSVDVDTVRLGVSVPLGKSGNSVPLNSVTGSIANGSHNVLTSGILGAF